MGRRGGKRFQRGRGGGKGGKGGQRPERADYQEVPKQNELYEKYYNDLGIVPPEERSEFWAALKRELPNSFRFTGSKGHAIPVQQRLKNHYIPEITSIQYEGRAVEPPAPLPWYPDDLGWQMTTPKAVVRRFGPFSSFQKFLVSETSVGNISRQEAVSMIPPLLMDIRPGMTVLDLCAAPGSKSAQLIEMVHGGEEARTRKIIREIKKEDGREISSDGNEIKLEIQEEERIGDWSDDGRTTGLLIANDIDYKRAHLLIHQMKRLNSPNLIVTNHDATIYPSIKLPSDPTPHGAIAKGKYLKFDRILADVPCSGDGTCRKNVNVWRDWNPGNAIGLFPTQVRILFRAIQMLKAGGRVVYSTCSMNPMENEAVVAAAFARCGGLDKVELVDCSSALPELRRSHGLTSWKVMDKQGKIWTSWQEVEHARTAIGDTGANKVVEEMFPQSGEGIAGQRVPLERCMRVYGHQQDTGSFFITVLQKKTELRARGDGEANRSKEQTFKAASKTSVIAVVEELEAKPNGSDAIEHIKALDDIAPPQLSDGDNDDPSATARQNKENAPSYAVSREKRELDEIADAEMATKRPKFREEDDGPAPQGAEDRQVHYPPPPGAELDLTRPISQPGPIPKISEPLPTPLASQTKKRNNQMFEEPFKFLDPNHPDLVTIFAFYQINPRFPRDRFMVRNASGNPVKTIYYTSELGRSILTENEGKGLKFVHCGIKMFVKQAVQREGTCEWRIQTDGLPILEAWVGEERVVRLRSRKTLKYLLVEMFPKVGGNGWQELGEIGERVRDMDMGCCVLRVEPGEGEDGFSERMVFPLWRSLSSLNLMLPKEDRKALLLRLYNEDIPLMDHSKDRHKVVDSSSVKEEERMTIGDDDEVLANGEADSSMGDKDIEADGNEMEVETQAAEELDIALGVKDEVDVGLEMGSDMVKGPADV
ncbi:hypothetical protein MMC26_004024 [Xylographa opegraphella]|nr:hypothetical protein [Xylographa opegraphella]